MIAHDCDAAARLAGSDLDAALEGCRPLAACAEPALATWALSCIGRAERRRGGLAAAYRRALRAVGHRHPPPSWAPLLLLHGGTAAADAEIAARRTPSIEEAARCALQPAGSDGKAGP